MGNITLAIRDAIPDTEATKEQAVADLLDEHPVQRATKLYKDIPDEITEFYMTQTSFE